MTEDTEEPWKGYNSMNYRLARIEDDLQRIKGMMDSLPIYFLESLGRSGVEEEARIEPTAHGEAPQTPTTEEALPPPPPPPGHGQMPEEVEGEAESSVPDMPAEAPPPETTEELQYLCPNCSTILKPDMNQCPGCQSLLLFE